MFQVYLMFLSLNELLAGMATTKICIENKKSQTLFFGQFDPFIHRKGRNVEMLCELSPKMLNRRE